MEKGRRYGSAEEYRERKKGALPLAVFLSFNDRGVHPQCPNATNPYHKCGRYCLDRIPSVKGFLDREGSGGSNVELEKMERKGVTPACPNASNIYHKCAEYCFEKIKREDAVEEPGKNKGVSFIADKNVVNSNCKLASNPYHRCDEPCMKNCHDVDQSKDVTKPKEQRIVHIADRRVSSHCKYASNPYHVCAEYCFQEVSKSGQPIQADVFSGMKVKSPKGGKKIDEDTNITSVNPHCKHASNPYHKCAEYCSKDIEERDKSDRAQSKEKWGDPSKESRPDHPAKEKSSIEASITTDSSKGISLHVGTIDSDSAIIKEDKGEATTTLIEVLDTQPLRIDATDLFKEWAKYCSLLAIENNDPNKGKTGQR